MTFPPSLRADALLLWDYLRMHHEPRPCSVAIALGSHDLGVADVAADAYRRGLAPLIVMTGASSPTSRDRMPRGEAVHYRERALELGVPESVILVEPKARNTGENFGYARELLQAAGVRVESVLSVSKPYEERRAYATIRKVWPSVEVVCASAPVSFDDYVGTIGDAHLVVDMMTGAAQRIMIYPGRGLTVAQDVPVDVRAAYERLREGGFTSRLIWGESENHGSSSGHGATAEGD